MTEPTDAQAATEQLQHFAACIAHDFNNLLTGMLGNLELMQMRAQRQKITTLEGYLEGARNAGNRAAIFASRLLAYSGRAGQTPKPTNAAELLATLAGALAETGQPITRGPIPASATILCDPALAELALQELFNNAAEALSPNGKITASLTTSPTHATITIHDTGHGMAPNTLALATTPFFTTRTSGAGRGLGLPIVTRFATQAGGRLELISQPEAGTTARLVVPLV
jgi:signal transduction histidine kinase